MYVICYFVFLTIAIQIVHLTNNGLSTKTDATIQLAAKTSTNSKLSTSAKLKTATSTSTSKQRRTDSMMSYLSGLQNTEESLDDSLDAEAESESGESTSNITPGTAKSHPAKTVRLSKAEIAKRKKLAALALKKKAKIIVNRKNPDVIVEHENSLKLIKEGWLKVSSSQLKNINRFPKILLPDTLEHQIPTERDYFRVNEGYDPVRNPQSPPSPFHFWMRLSFRNLYYALTQDSINVVGTIPVDDIDDAVVLKEYSRSANCFKILDQQSKDWTLCATSKEDRNQWVCKIKAVKKLESEQLCVKRLLADEAIIIEKRVTQPIILIPLASPMCNENFNYLMNGLDWNCDCKEGREQSPLDLPGKESAIKSPVKPIFEYHEVDIREVLTTIDGSLKSRENLKIEIVNHALKIKHNNFGRVVTMDGSLYTAQEIIFHTPAEHSINGKIYDMEMQIIHFGQTTGDIARQVILCFVFEKKPGFYNKFIDDIDFFTLPNPLSPSKDLENKLFIPKIFYNAKDDDIAIMKPFDFYTYQGSLTAPPCTERTIVYVAAKPIKLGTTAIQLFQEALRTPDLMAIPSGDILVSNAITHNNRAIQNRNGRNIFYFDSSEDMCIEKPKGKPRKQGHFERLDKEMTQYYFVSGSKPSGMPGAFVVSKNEAVGKGLLTP